MKNLKPIATLLCTSALVASCNSGSINTDNESINNVTIQSITPPNGATNLGLGQKITLQINKGLKTDTLQKHITVQTTTGQNIPITITGENGTYSISAKHGLQPNTTYVFTSDIPEQNSTNYISLKTSSTYIVTTQPAYKIFITSAKTKGWLGSTSTEAAIGADNKCNSDANRPDTTVYYKAMLGIPDVRYSCNDSGTCGSGYNLDWVLSPSTAYFNTAGNTITTTDIFSTFDFPTSQPINSVATNAWTGLNNSWGIKSTCENWTYGGNNHQGRRGNSSRTDGKLIDDDKHNCDNQYSLYCVQQPQATITSPLLSPMNQYIVDDNNATITIQINSISPINSATVNSNSFSVINNSTQTAVTGGVTSLGSNRYKFTPDIEYNSGTQYIVNLTNDIKDSNGTSIRPTTLFFITAAKTKLMYVTNEKYWGNLGGISGADAKCQADTQCPNGKACKAIIMASNERYACTSKSACGGTNSKEWVLTPNTTYLNTESQIISTTNSAGTFGSDGVFVFNFPIKSDENKAWTGFDNYFMINKDANCQNWTIGDSGINKLGGLYGNSANILPYAFTQDGGGCSKYTNKVDYGVYVDKQCNAPGGCSTRHLYCAEQ